MDSAAAGAGGAGLHVSFRTMCGREIRVGHLALGGGRHPARRVSLDIGAASGGGDGTWAGLTAGEARRLAAALLTHAAVCDTRPPQPEEAPAAASAERSHLRTCPAVQGQVHRFSSGTLAMT